jgi:hypothetical protein
MAFQLLTGNSPDLDSFKEIIASWTSGNEIIDKFIREIQLNYNENRVVFEWILYNKFIEIKEIDGNCYSNMGRRSITL